MMIRKNKIIALLSISALVVMKLFSTPPGSKIFYILLAFLILFLTAAIYHFIKRKEPVKSSKNT
jgi:hypothetical protein